MVGGVPAAIGFSQECGIPFELGIIRSHYVGRTFIQPSQDIRSLGVKLKHNANHALIRGKRIVLIDGEVAGAINRKPPSGYKVVYVGFVDGRPQGLPIDVLTGFLGADHVTSHHQFVGFSSSN